jgi:hypothetical protein
MSNTEPQATEEPEIPFEGLDEPDESEQDDSPDGDDFGQDDEDDAQQEPEAQGPQELTPEQLEKRAKACETSFRTYTRTVTRQYAEEAQYLTECPLCPDQHKGFVDVRQAGYVPQEIQDAVRLYFGIAREQDYTRSRRYRTCDECDGKGKVSTGSNVPEHATIQCQECGGRGYIGPPTQHQENGHVTSGPTVYGLEPPQSQAMDDVDEWDEPRILPDGRENPNFGKMPNRKILVEPWGVTAGLNALSTAGGAQ